MRQIEILEDEYYSVNDALKILNISRATLYSKIKTEELTSKLINKRRFVFIDQDVRLQYTFSLFENQTAEQSNQTAKHTAEHTTEQQEKQRILADIEYFKQQNTELQQELSSMRKASEEASQRHDTIVMKLSSTIEEQSLQLEEFKSKTFFQKLVQLFS